jgi:hypothetical protein
MFLDIYPGNSLDRNLSYQIGKDISDIAQKHRYTSVRFVGVLWQHDKPWIYRWVREVNLQLERLLVEFCWTHIDVSSILRSEHTVHGLHLNP